MLVTTLVRCILYLGSLCYYAKCHNRSWAQYVILTTDARLCSWHGRPGSFKSGRLLGGLAAALLWGVAMPRQTHLTAGLCRSEQDWRFSLHSIHWLQIESWAGAKRRVFLSKPLRPASVCAAASMLPAQSVLVCSTLLSVRHLQHNRQAPVKPECCRN